MNNPRAGKGLWTASRNSPLVERNILAVSELERQALENRTPAEKFSDGVVSQAGRLRSVVAHALFFGLWVTWNLKITPLYPKFDPFPSPALITVVSLEAIFLALFILLSENRSSRRAEERAHLDLQINLLAEHESTKTLELLQALCAFHGLRQAQDPEVVELLQRTEPAMLAREIERQLPSEVAASPVDTDGV